MMRHRFRYGPLVFRDPLLLCGTLYVLLYFDASGFLRLGLLAAFLHIFSHALTKPMLFLSASGLRDVSGGHNDFPSLQGAGHRNVAAGVLFTAGALSMVGVPLFIGFIPKLQFAQAAFALTWEKWPVLLALAVSTLLNVLYFLYTTLLLWVPEAETERTRRLRWASVPGLVFAALNIAVGLRSYGLMDLFRQGMDLFCQ